MKCEIIIDPDREEQVVIFAQKMTPLIRDIQELAEGADFQLAGYQDKVLVPLDPSTIFCITVIRNKTYAVCEKETFLLKERLYVLEEKLPDYFIKINQSSIANIKKIQRFDASISGTLKLRFQNGHIDYVSRRQLKYVKERIGI